MIIDAHLHFWPARFGRYHWKQQQPRLADASNAARLRQEAPGLALVGAVHVEAGYDNHNPLAELHWLLGQRTGSGLPSAMVAGVDLHDTQAPALLSACQALGARGVRQIVEDAAWLAAQAWQGHFALLGKLGLCFDAQLPQGNWQALHSLADLCAAHPGTSVILNHGGFAPLAEPQHWPLWRQAMIRLATQPQVAVKLSGLAMMKPHWTQQDGRRLLDELLVLFGEDRVMLASNFPVEPGNYGEIWGKLLAVAGHLPPSSRYKLTAANAGRWYGSDAGANR